MKSHCLLKSLLICLIGMALNSTPTQAQIPLDSSSLLQHNRSIHAMVVSVEDRIVYAQSFNGYNLDALFNNQSLTKNIMALLLGIAIDQGYIESADVKIAHYIPELNQDPDKRKLQITLRDIMNQASGLWHEDLRHLGKYLKLKNPSQYTLKQELTADPGSELHYNNAASHLMSVILSKATGKSTLDFANTYLFRPLQIQEVDWPKMKDGYYDGGGLLSVHLSTTDMNKIGRMILYHGKFNEKQIVSEQWIQQLLQPQKTYAAPWELTNTRYGLTFYHTAYNNIPITYGMGWGGQFLILVPKLHATISVNQQVNDRTAVQQSTFFMSQILPMIIDWIEMQSGK